MWVNLNSKYQDNCKWWVQVTVSRNQSYPASSVGVCARARSAFSWSRARGGRQVRRGSRCTGQCRARPMRSSPTPRPCWRSGCGSRSWGCWERKRETTRLVSITVCPWVQHHCVPFISKLKKTEESFCCCCYTDQLIMMAIIYIAPYLTDKGEHTVLYKIYKNVLIKPKKCFKKKYCIACTPYPHTSTPTLTHMLTGELYQGRREGEVGEKWINFKSLVVVLFVEASF